MKRWSIYWLTRIRGYRLEEWGDGDVARLRKGNPAISRSYQRPFSLRPFLRQVGQHWFGIGSRSPGYSVFVRVREEDFA